MKQYYDYSPELPETSTTGNLNLESPLLRPVIAWIRKIARDAVKKENLPNFTIGSIDCYRVEPDSSEKLPAILYCHGGGFFLPLQPAMVRIGRYYQEHLNVRVFFPEYRIAPEDPFPTPFDDCYRSYCYLIQHADELKIDPQRIVVLGDSAGGALAAAVCQKARDEGLVMPKLQMLFVPVTDNSMQHESIEKYAMGAWSKTATYHMWRMYLKNGDHGMLRYAAPLQSQNFANLPPSYVEVAEMDCLCDEGIAYARQMENAGVEVELHIVERAYHGYDGQFDSPLTQRELKRRVEFMRNHL